MSRRSRHGDRPITKVETVSINSNREDPGTRERILTAATAAFARSGFHATSIRSIAAAARTSTSALYVHFASKEEVLYEITRNGHDELQSRLNESLTGDDPLHNLESWMHAFVLFHTQEPTVARMVNHELPALTPTHLADIERARRDLNKALSSLIETTAKLGLLRVEDTRIATAAVLSLGIDVARWFDPDREWSGDDLASRYTVLALRMLDVDAA